MPLGHLGVNVSDLPAARAYYDELMPMLGFECVHEAAGEFGYAPAGGKIGTCLFFYPALEEGGYSRHRPGPQHLAFMVKTRAEVRALHQWAVAAGATVLEEPKAFPQYGPSYYATFWEGPDGVMLEAVCHKDDEG
jgi:catechol 2,3-dioxygenase-like lactoylglutathione lyase family enzyme